VLSSTIPVSASCWSDWVWAAIIHTDLCNRHLVGMDVRAACRCCMKTASLIGLFVIVLPVSLWAVDGWKTARLQV
jgi:hypothetical protein